MSAEQRYPPEIDLNIDEKGFGEKIILRNFQLAVERGDHVCMMGPSGVGKSTILRIIAGLDLNYLGSARHREKTIKGPSRRRELLFQDARLLPWFNVHQNVAYGLPDSLSNDEKQEIAREAIEAVDLAAHSRKLPAELSGGMQKRTALARCIANKPEVLLLDEPFTGLDITLKYELQDLLRGLRARHQLTIVHVTHDIEEAVYLADSIVLVPSKIGGEVVQIPAHQPHAATRDDDRMAKNFRTVAAALARLR